MAFGYPSSRGVFIPNWEDSGNLAVGFSRDPSTFKINQWTSQTPVQREKGYYLRLNQDTCARVLDSTGRLTVWPPGNDSPQFYVGGEQFEYSPFQTYRYADGWVLDYLTYEQAEWDIRAQYNAWTAQRVMTQREVQTITPATDTANYDATHYDTAADWGGGYLDQGTSTNPILKRALQRMFIRIFEDTRGTVRPQDMVVVLSPASAYAISRSQEITDFLKNNVYGLPQLRGGTPGQNDLWGLPDRYQDFKLVVDDTIYVSADAAAPGGTVPAQGYSAWPWGTVAMFARPGGLQAPAGGTSFSTVHLFLKEDMNVETMDDVNNRRYTTRITNNWVPKVVAPVTGCLCTSSFATDPSLGDAFIMDDRPKMREFLANKQAQALAAHAAASPDTERFRAVEEELRQMREANVGLSTQNKWLLENLERINQQVSDLQGKIGQIGK